MANWYVRRGEKVAGPVDASRLEQLAAAGRLWPTDQVAQDLAGPWHVASDTTLFPPPDQMMSETVPTSVPSDTAQSTRAIRVGGWLLVFCVILTIIRPLYLVVSFVQSYQVLTLLDFDSHAALRITIIWELVGFAALIAYGSVIGFKIWLGHPQGPELARRFLVINLVGSLAVEVIAVLLIMNESNRQVFQEGLIGAFKYVLQALVFFAIWWAYFKKSKRVSNTYGLERFQSTF
jgi:uncharacterized protein DUF2569